MLGLWIDLIFIMRTLVIYSPCSAHSRWIQVDLGRFDDLDRFFEKLLVFKKNPDRNSTGYARDYLREQYFERIHTPNRSPRPSPCRRNQITAQIHHPLPASGAPVTPRRSPYRIIKGRRGSCGISGIWDRVACLSLCALRGITNTP